MCPFLNDCNFAQIDPPHRPCQFGNGAPRSEREQSSLRFGFVSSVQKGTHSTDPSIYPNKLKSWPMDGIESCRKSTTAGFVNDSVLVIQSHLRSSIFGALNPSLGQLLRLFGYTEDSWLSIIYTQTPAERLFVITSKLSHTILI